MKLDMRHGHTPESHARMSVGLDFAQRLNTNPEAYFGHYAVAVSRGQAAWAEDQEEEEGA